MTTPTTPTPTLWKTMFAALGGVLTLAIPPLLQYSTAMPQPWPSVIAGVVGVLMLFGVYKAPYLPSGTTIATKKVT